MSKPRNVSIDQILSFAVIAYIIHQAQFDSQARLNTWTKLKYEQERKPSIADKHHRKPSAVRKVFTPVGEVVERESTKPTAPAENLVRRALDFIDANATAGIGVADVVRHLGVSRRLADLRFAQTAGTTIRRALEDRKLDEVKRRLVHTSLSIEKISRLSGYANVQRLKYVFRARTGMSMTDYRTARTSTS